MITVKHKIVTVKDMLYLFCPLPLPLSVMVTGQDGDMGQNIML